MKTPEIHQLIEQYLQGEISAEDFARLESCLRDDPQARQLYRRAANLDSALRDRLVQDECLQAWTLPPPASKPRRNPMPPGWFAIAAVLVGLLCLGAFRWGTHHGSAKSLANALPKGEETDLGCAVLTQALEAEWGGGAAPAKLGETLNTGPVSLKKGLAQIEFFSGATLLVEGPAELDLVSQWEVVCRQGKARVRVPPAARGFRLLAPGMKLVDLGTEFGVEVSSTDARARVHVFEGEVEAHPDSGRQVNVTAGQSIEQHGADLQRVAAGPPGEFIDTEHLQKLGQARARQRLESWRLFSQKMRADSRLIAYYPMQQVPMFSRSVPNAMAPADASKNGGAVGAVWAQGRWPGKDALEFKHSGDRVRLRIDGTYDELTLACWVRVDGLDRKYNALILTDGYEPGAPHWQIEEDGRLMFSLIYPGPANSAKKRNQIYYSPAIFGSTSRGRWRHLAVTYENRTGVAIQYVDGAEVSREISPFHAPGRKMQFGPCELGNWGLPTPGHKFPIRNLNGSLDEFAIYRAALPAEEIRALYEGGKQ